MSAPDLTDAAEQRPAPSTPDGRPRRSRRPRSSGAGIALLIGGYLLTVVAMGVGVYTSRFRISNIDGISYISLAGQYADGSFGTAVNAFWSPLVSWAMAPLMVVGIEGTTAFLLVNLVAGAVGTAVGTILVLRHTRGNAWAAGIFLVGAGVFNVSSVYLLTPDLLVANWTVIFVAVLTWVTSGAPWRSRRAVIAHGAVLGATCAAGYLTKLYLVPVFVVVLLAWAGWVLLTQRKATVGAEAPGPARVTAVLGVAVVVFTLVSAPWIAALTHKYGHVTLGSSFTVNIESKFEPDSPEAQAVPLTLYAPPNERAVSFGEDRTFDVSGSILESAAAPVDRLRYYVSQRIAAFPHYLDKVASIAPLAFVGIAALFLAMAFGRVSARRHPLATVASLVWLVYFAGYAGITTAANSGGNARYYWPLLPLWLLVVAAVAPPLWRNAAATRPRWRAGLAFLLIAVVPLASIWQFGLGRSAPFSTSQGPAGISDTLNTVPERSTVQALTEDDLARFIEPGDRIVGSNFRTTVLMAFYLGAQAYGRSAQPYNVDDEAFRSLLRSNEIDYYLYYSPVAAALPLPNGLNDLGVVVGSFTTDMPCGDTSGAPVESCELTVVEVQG